MWVRVGSAVLFASLCIAGAGRGVSCLSDAPIFCNAFESPLCGSWAWVVTPDFCNGADDDCDLEIDEDAGCGASDGCCPGAGLGSCHFDVDVDCPSVCGDGIVDSGGGETCDGNCPSCGPASYSCLASSGSADTCDLLCDQPAACGTTGDTCCPYGCGSGSDSDCAASQWQQVLFGQASYVSGCVTLFVYGISPGGSYVFTTCSPGGGEAPGTGDPVIVSVVDNLGTSYPVANDDCTDQYSLPALAGWSCLDDVGELHMSCASPSPGGFVVNNFGVFRLDVTVCPFNGAYGTAPFHVWWNGPGTPNPG